MAISALSIGAHATLLWFYKKLDMNNYEEKAFQELALWKLKMKEDPGVLELAARNVQTRINKLIPDKVHQAITIAIEKMVKAVLFGATYTSSGPRPEGSIHLREAFVRERIEFYRKTASAEGALTGAGGFLLGLADFPILIGIKLKFLFDVASLYGFDTRDYKERLYLLYIFQLAFSSPPARTNVFNRMEDWHAYQSKLPADAEEFDWRTFQQEYRDYIDLAKMAQLVPVIGAAVGAIVNYKLLNKLGETAMNCYRIRFAARVRITEARN